MSHILDRPIWNALQTAHAELAEGGEYAMRYPPSIVPFAATADDSRESLEALENLPAADEVMAIVEAGPVTIPQGLTVVSEGKLVQMIAERPYERISDSRLQPLTPDDADEMLALAMLTKPGPFTLGARNLAPSGASRSTAGLSPWPGSACDIPDLASSAAFAPILIFRGKASAPCSSASSPAKFPPGGTPSSFMPITPTLQP